jgi:hypothetical protein
VVRAIALNIALRFEQAADAWGSNRGWCCTAWQHC